MSEMIDVSLINSPMKIMLLVRNNNRFTIRVSAKMNCYLNNGSKIIELQNAPMCWESSGTNIRDIHPDAVAILNLCESDEIYNDNVLQSYCIKFYWFERNAIRITYTDHSPIKADIKLTWHKKSKFSFIKHTKHCIFTISYDNDNMPFLNIKEEKRMKVFAFKKTELETKEDWDNSFAITEITKKNSRNK